MVFRSFSYIQFYCFWFFPQFSSGNIPTALNPKFKTIQKSLRFAFKFSINFHENSSVFKERTLFKVPYFLQIKKTHFLKTKINKFLCLKELKNTSAMVQFSYVFKFHTIVILILDLRFPKFLIYK